MTLTPIAERLAMELTLPDFTDLDLSRLGFKHPTFRLRGQCSNLLSHNALLFICVGLESCRDNGPNERLRLNSHVDGG